MKKIVYLPFICFLIFCSCTKHTSKSTTTASTCLDFKIQDFSKNSCEKGATVKEYNFQGHKVYVFNPGNCGADMTSEVTDKECKSLGFLGGMTGNTKINGEDFEQASFLKTVWEK